MKKIVRLITLAAFILCITGAVCFAEGYDYYPDEKGMYTVSFEGKKSNEYIIIAVKGIYEEKNFVEAWKNAPDEDILYYDQKNAEDDGQVKFGPFAPTRYADSTLIIGGTDLSEPVLAGYMRKGNASNIASVKIGGTDEAYTVNGLDGEDISINVKAELLNSYGYIAVTEEKAAFTAASDTVDFKCDPVTGVVSIDKCSPAGTVTVTATYAELSDSVTFAVNRLTPKAHHVSFFAKENDKKSITSLNAELKEGTESVTVNIYSGVFDMYGDKFDDELVFYVNGDENTSGNVVTFTSARSNTVKAVSVSDENVYAYLTINVAAVPAYEGKALELYELIKSCEEELNLIDDEKFISEKGFDVYPDATWTTAAKKSDFEKALELAKTDLEKAKTDSITEDKLSSRVKTLTAALETYRKSFSAGKRVDIQSISFENKTLRIPVTNNTVALSPKILPAEYTESIKWKSSDAETVYVDESGNVVAKKSGTAIITVSSDSGVTAFVTVTAYKKATRIQLSESKVNLTYGEEPFVLGMTAYPADQSEIFTWTSSNTAVAAVSQTGTITAKAKAGTTLITVTGESGVSATCTVNVSLPKWDTVSAPAASVAQGNVIKGTKVALTTSTESAKIYYTLDGSEPTSASRPYTAPIVLNSDVTLKAVAVADKMFDSPVVTYVYSVVVPKISLKTPSSVAEETADVALKLENNPGIKSLSFKLELPAGVEISSIADGVVSGFTFAKTELDNVYLIKRTGGEVAAENGTAATLTLKIGSEVKNGEYELKISELMLISADGSTIAAESAAEKLIISEVTVGDVNGDGKINIDDLILLSKYCAGWESVKDIVVSDAADTNGDGKINIDDLILLSKYCAGWNVTLGK